MLQLHLHFLILKKATKKPKNKRIRSPNIPLEGAQVTPVIHLNLVRKYQDLTVFIALGGLNRL